MYCFALPKIYLYGCVSIVDAMILCSCTCTVYSALELCLYLHRRPALEFVHARASMIHRDSLCGCGSSFVHFHVQQRVSQRHIVSLDRRTMEMFENGVVFQDVAVQMQ